jgi:hypothetical protein
MLKYRLEDMIGGWFVGNFEPSAFVTDKFEICYKFHKLGEFWDEHYHRVATEINLLVRGKMLINNEEINAGEIFIIEPLHKVKPHFLTDCELVVIKTPSVQNDKIITNLIV